MYNVSMQYVEMYFTTDPGSHASRWKCRYFLFEADSSHTYHIHHVSWVIEGAGEKGREGVCECVCVCVLATDPYRGPSLPIADTIMTPLAVSSHTW